METTYTKTDNLGLDLYGDNDPADLREGYNSSMRKIDSTVKANVDAIATKADKATTYSKTDVDTKLSTKADSATTYSKLDVDGKLSAVVKSFATVQEMSADSTLTAGMTVQTKGYHEEGDNGGALYIIVSNGVTDSGTIPISGSDDLFAEILGVPTLAQLGVQKNGDTPVADSINSALSWLNSKGLTFARLDAGTFLIDKPICLYENQELSGTGRFSTILKQSDNAQMSEPIVTVISWNSTPIEVSNIAIRNMTIRSHGERTEYPVLFCNGDSQIVENCRIQQELESDSKFHGISLGTKRNGFSGQTYVGKIINSRISAGKILLATTDSYIYQNEIWAEGNGIDCAIELTGASNSMIMGNQIVGGRTNGSIYTTSNTIEGLQIVGNYFDGSWSPLDTGNAINFGNIKNVMVSNNHFWHIKASAIVTYANAHNVNIVGNNFNECDYYNHGVPDIQTAGQSYGITLQGNVFFRSQCLDSNHTNVIDRPTESPAPIAILSLLSSVVPTVITGNTVSFEQFYSPITVSDGGLVSVHGNSSKLFNPGPKYQAMVNPGDIRSQSGSYGKLIQIQVDDNTNIPLLPSITSNSSLLTSNVDVSVAAGASFVIYADDLSKLDNTPSWVTPGTIIEYVYAGKGYGIMKYCTPEGIIAMQSFSKGTAGTLRKVTLG